MQSLDHHLIQLLLLSSDIQICDADISDADDAAPVTYTQAQFPLVMRTIALITAAVIIEQGYLAEVCGMQAGFGALRIDAMHSVLTPANKPERSGVLSSRAHIVYMSQSSRVGLCSRLGIIVAGQASVARSQTKELLRICSGITVEDSSGHSLGHTLKMRGVFRHTELGRVTIQGGQVLVNLGVIFQHTNGVINLYGGRLGRPNAIVEFAPGRLRQIGAYGGTMAGRQVTFNERDVFQNRVVLVQNFCDARNFPVRVKAFGYVDQVGKLSAIVGYESHDLFLVRWVIIPEK